VAKRHIPISAFSGSGDSHPSDKPLPRHVWHDAAMRIVDPDSGRSRFQKRRRRFDDVSQPRELTFTCYRGYPFLAREHTRNWFREALQSARSKLGVELWAYVVMPEHVHLVVLPGSEDGRVSRFLRAVKEPVARQAIEYLKTASPQWLEKVAVREGSHLRHRFWQPGGGYDRNVTEVSTLRSMIDYIHANPVRRGLVDRPEDWEWSSARWFAGLRPAKIEMDASVIEELSGGL
jgi:putative transposase